MTDRTPDVYLQAILNTLQGNDPGDVPPANWNYEQYLVAILQALTGATLPPVSASDNGKALMVENGAWATGKSVYIISSNGSTADIGASAISALAQSGVLPVLMYSGAYYVYTHTSGSAFFVTSSCSSNNNVIYRQVSVTSNKSINTFSSITLYKKPTDGIPETDLAQTVKDKLNKFVVTLTPTSPDYSGTMDKTVAEINAAYEAGQEIWFKVLRSASMSVEIPLTYWATNSDCDYHGFSANIMDVSANMLIVAFVGSRNDGTWQTYETKVYPLTPAT